MCVYPDGRTSPSSPPPSSDFPSSPPPFASIGVDQGGVGLGLGLGLLRQDSPVAMLASTVGRDSPVVLRVMSALAGPAPAARPTSAVNNAPPTDT